MCGKGSKPVTQTQTYSPAPEAYGAISGALSQGQQVAQTPFQTPVAPVAGFSPQQQQAFDVTGQAQGMALPFFGAAANYFSPQGAQAFMNPYASNVMAGMKDIFGQQMSQTTGNLTQQAGGTGADRIAIGQSELAKQQGLAAGQTLSDLYGRAVGQAQSAGFGMGSLGPAAQGSVLQGAQALLGTGGLQQQLAQAQANAPYQNILQRIAWPYQNAQFNAGITGALAPGLGGTTGGQTNYPAPSPWGQIAGLGMTAAGLFGPGLSNIGQGYNWNGSMSGDQWAQAGQGAGPYAAASPSYGMADGGEVDSGADDLAIRQAEINALHGDATVGGAPPIGLPTGAAGAPINMAPQSIVPQGGLTPIKPTIPQLPAPQQGGGSGGGSGMGDAMKIAATVLPLLLNRGGRANPYTYQEGGPTTFNDRWSALSDPFPSELPENQVPLPPARPELAAADNAPIDGEVLPPMASPTMAPAANPYAMQASTPPTAETPNASMPARPRGFMDSPWAALLQAGLGTMAAAGQRDARGLPTPPLAAIGQGGLAGLKALEGQREAQWKDLTHEEAVRRLDQQVQLHREQMAQTKELHGTMTPYQRETLAAAAAKPVSIGTGPLGEIKAVRMPNGDYRDIMTGEIYKGTSVDAGAPEKGQISAPQAGNAAVIQAMRDGKHGKEFLDVVPVGQKNLIEAIGNYDQNPNTSSIRGGRREKVMDMVRQYNPVYDQNYYGAKSAAIKEFLAGGQNSPAGQITYANTAIGHAGDMSDALEELKSVPGFLAGVSQSNVPFVSYAAARLKNAAVQGTQEGKALAKYMTAYTLFSAELSRLYSGSQGSQEERNTVRAPLDPNKSYLELAGGSIPTAVRMLQSRTGALEDRWQTALDAPGLKEYSTKKQFRDFPVIKERSRQALGRIEQRAQATSQTPGTPAAPASADHARALKWANENPNDPRAAAIKKRLGVP